MNRERFPGLAGSSWARLDGPAGTQMVDAAIEAMDDWMRSGRGANHGGPFAAAKATAELVESARLSAGALLGSPPSEIVFGFSTTALTMAFAGAVGRTLEPGDEIVCTRLDHDANVRPWVIHAERAGATVRFADPDAETLELPASAVDAVIGERTRWVAVTHASNAVGTIPDLPGIVAAARRVGARVYVDAVHAAPHRRIDVAALGCDALACSAYKWFGPHIGVLWARPGLLEAIPGVALHGRARDRTATLMFTVEGRSPADVAAALAEREVAVWDGNYYAWELERFLGLDPGGAVRAGFVHYNDEDDVARLLDAVRGL
jgi:selenocysteine lyase/cysteine desulfurase